MATPRLDVTLRKINRDLDKISEFREGMNGLSPSHQIFIAEILMLRIFSIFEDSIAEVAFKIAVGATYTNGNVPAITSRVGSMNASRNLFLSYDRPSPLKYLKWTRSRDIRKSTNNVIPETECFSQTVIRYANNINEMRNIRNYIAHRNTSTKTEYLAVIRRIYGIPRPYLNQAGKLLLATDLNPETNLVRYIQETKILFNEMCSG